MNTNQLNNLINFTLLFHKVHVDGYYLQQSPSYIIEKYDKMIGFDPLSPVDDGNKFHNALKVSYLKRWNVVNPSPKIISILNYFLEIHSESFSVHRVIDLFSIHIGSMELITNKVYSHLHPILISFIEKVKSDQQREINLELLS